MEFISGTPENKKGKAIFYVKESLSGGIYALFSSKDELELRKILNGSINEKIIEEICQKKENIVDEMYYYPDPIPVNEEELRQNKEFDLIYCGDINAQTIDEVKKVLFDAYNSYQNDYHNQKRKDHMTVKEAFEINKEISYNDSYRNYNGDDLRAKLNSHLACLLDSINLNRRNDLEDMLFKIKFFFKGFSCPNLISTILEVSQQEIPPKKKNELVSLLADEIIAVRDEKYEKAEKIKNKLKRFKVNYSKTI